MDRRHLTGEFTVFRAKECGGTRPVVMTTDGGRDQVATTIARTGWHSFERPLPQVLAAVAAQARRCDLRRRCQHRLLRPAGPPREPPRRGPGLRALPAGARAARAQRGLERQQRRRRGLPPSGREPGRAALYVPEQGHGLVETSASLDPSFKDAAPRRHGRGRRGHPRRVNAGLRPRARWPSSRSTSRGWSTPCSSGATGLLRRIGHGSWWRCCRPATSPPWRSTAPGSATSTSSSTRTARSRRRRGGLRPDGVEPPLGAPHRVGARPAPAPRRRALAGTQPARHRLTHRPSTVAPGGRMGRRTLSGCRRPCDKHCSSPSEGRCSPVWPSCWRAVASSRCATRSAGWRSASSG